MLYKKNGSRNLDKKLFENPTCEYRGTPFWSWNCKLEEGILKRQIEYLKEMGFGGFHMHSRTGMASEYLSEEFMELVKACVEKAEDEDMIAWLYDEDRWPSGFAGGLVTKEIKYRAKYLTFTSVNRNDDAKDLDESLKTGKPCFLASFDVTLNKKGELSDYRRIDRNEDAKGDKWYAFMDIHGNSPWFNNQSYVDTLDNESVKRFIDITYEAYKKAIGDKFEKSVPAIFTDEPQVTRRQYFDKAKEKQNAILPWTHKLCEGFYAVYNYDILDKIPELIWTLPDNKVSRVMYDYNNFIAELFAKAFSDQCGTWCENNNLMLTGHMMEEPTLHSQAYAIGEAMRHYRSFQLPGIDMLCNLVEFTTAKQAQSASHQYGREGVLSELYGVTNWDYDFRGHKFQGDWQAALGITVRVPHLSWVSMAGEAKRDYPASISYQSPWFKEYPYIENHFARLNTALTRGKALVKVGVIHPIESYWIHLGPNDTTGALLAQKDQNFQSITTWLLLDQIDFDFICESEFPSLCSEGSYPLNVGKMSYETIIVPDMETMRRTTYERLKRFKEKGGRIVFIGNCPKYIDAVESDEVNELYSQSVVVELDKSKILNELKKDKILEIYAGNTIADKYIYNMREDNDCNWLFVARGVQETNKESTYSESLTIEIKGEFIPFVYDTLNGNIKIASYKTENGKTYVYAIMHGHDSILLKLNKARNVDINNNVEFSLEEPNVLLLDMAEFALDDEEFSAEEEILRGDNILRKRLSWPLRMTSFAQPWTVEKEEITHNARLRFTINSDIEVKNPVLAIEDAERLSIEFNGQKVVPNVTGYYVDESIKTVNLPAIKKGVNTMIVKIPFGRRTNIEWCYILGDFGVNVKGRDKVITEAPQMISYGSYVNQGLAFYGGNVVYKNNITVDNDCCLRIKLPSYRGSLVKILLDSQEVGKIVFSPYETVINNVKAGKHEIQFILYGNRFNTFASVHNCNKKWYWFGPDAWRTNGEDWTYDYCLKDTGILEKPIIEII